MIVTTKMIQNIKQYVKDNTLEEISTKDVHQFYFGIDEDGTLLITDEFNNSQCYDVNDEIQLKYATYDLTDEFIGVLQKLELC